MRDSQATVLEGRPSPAAPAAASPEGRGEDALRVKTKPSLPPWFKVRPPSGDKLAWLKQQRQHHGLTTVCEEARCPNLAECWSQGTATFMVMGALCSRACRFCHVASGQPNGWLDADEPQKLAQVVAEAGWHYVVITSVDRDDLPDGGAAHIAACITAVRHAAPNCAVEVLIPDFAGDAEALATVLHAQPHVLAHNLETVARLSPTVRDRRAGYQQSLTLLQRAKASGLVQLTKSSLMLGLGETEAEVHQALADLRQHGVDVVTLGQYLQPSPKHLAVEAFIPPEQFATWQTLATETYGFVYCASGPLVRSSYKAGEVAMRGLLHLG